MGSVHLRRSASDFIRDCEVGLNLIVPDGIPAVKTFAKALLSNLCLLAVLPAVGLYRLQSIICGSDRTFSGWSQLFSLLPGQTGIYLRRAFYSCTLKVCRPDACISFGTLFTNPKASVGRTTCVGGFCSIGNVQIGDDVLIASHVSLMNGCHQHGIERLDVPMREQPGELEPISIGDDTWIGERATVAANVGTHCIIGAGALVLTPIPDYAIAVGSPARVIRDRRDGEAAEASAEFPQPTTGRGESPTASNHP